MNDGHAEQSKTSIVAADLKSTELSERVVHEAGVVVLAVGGYLAATKGDQQAGNLRGALTDAAERLHNLAEMAAAKANNRAPRWTLPTL